MQSTAKRGSKVLIALLSVAIVIEMGSTSFGQSREGRPDAFRIRDVAPAFVELPDTAPANYSKRGVPAGTPRKWLQVEVIFDSEPDWADDVEIRWFIQVAADKGFVVFSDSVTHINVKKGSRHNSVIYVPPRTVDRYSMTTKVKEIAVQLWHKQRLVDTSGWRGTPKTRWWEEVAPVKGALLNLQQTPFYVIDYDRYEQIKVGSAP